MRTSAEVEPSSLRLLEVAFVVFCFFFGCVWSASEAEADATSEAEPPLSAADAPACHGTVGGDKQVRVKGPHQAVRCDASSS